MMLPSDGSEILPIFSQSKLNEALFIDDPFSDGNRGNVNFRICNSKERKLTQQCYNFFFGGFSLRMCHSVPINQEENGLDPMLSRWGSAHAVEPSHFRVPAVDPLEWGSRGGCFIGGGQ